MWPTSDLQKDGSHDNRGGISKLCLWGLGNGQETLRRSSLDQTRQTTISIQTSEKKEKKHIILYYK
jgi:hypothetical protein